MKRNRLLVLDDDPMIGQTIQVIANACGFETQFTAQPSAFFQALDTWEPSHIALDLVMPEMDGVEVMVELAHQGCQAKIVITSGVGSRVLDAAERSATEHGLDIIGALPKPFSASHLRQLLSAPVEEPAPKPQPVTVGETPDITESELRRALAEREFVLAYQPKIECQTGKLAGFEALVRWQHPTKGMIWPDRFVPLAEQQGHIDALTEQVLEMGLRWFARFLDSAGRKLPVELSPLRHLSVNLSARSLQNIRLADAMADNVHQAGLSPEDIIFELTETSAMEDPTSSLDLLTRLRMKGFNLSIDDFGTGYSSMLQLVRLPFSELKVDKSFVLNASYSLESRAVIKSIVGLGKSLGLRVIAEGVEDARTLDYLCEIGCDLAQGYYIGRPMLEYDIFVWLKQGGYRSA